VPSLLTGVDSRLEFLVLDKFHLVVMFALLVDKNDLALFTYQLK